MAEPATTRKADERNHTLNEVRRLLGEGASEEDIKLELCLSDHEWVKYRTAVLNQERVKTARPAVEIFIEYQLRQLAHIDQLEAARKNATKASDEISAVKAKAELLDKIIAKGQDLGVYHREGQKLTVKGAMGLVHMTPSELAENLDHGVMKLKALAEDLGRPLEIGNLIQAMQKPAAPLRLVEPQAAIEVAGSEVVDPFEETDPGPPGPPSPPPSAAPEPDPDSAVPEPVTSPEVTIPERRRGRGTSGLKHGGGDPGPDRPKAERLFEAAMHPRAGVHAAKKGEVIGDPAGLRARVHIQCPRCQKRVQGIPGLTRHLCFFHQVPDDEALKSAQDAAEHERMAVARAYVERTAGQDDDLEGAG